MTSPAEQLSGLVPGSVYTGWQLVIGQMIDKPNKAIVFYDTGGMNPNPRWLVDYNTVMVQVRGEPNSYGAGFTKAREVRDSLLGKDSMNLTSGDRLVNITCMGDVNFLSYDDAKRPIFSINFRTIIEPATNSLVQRDPL